MTRIPAEELERLKREVSLQRLVEDSGVELKQQGKDLVGRCPWHQDDTPSLLISTSKNLWHCMGACQEGGSVIDWVMKTKGVAFLAAVEWLQELNGGAATAAGGADPNAPLLNATATDQELLAQVVARYHARLKECPDAQAYLRDERGLQHSEFVDAFQIGVVDNTLNQVMASRQSPPGRQIREQLQKLGICRKDSGKEHFNGCVVFPLIDDDTGAVVGLYGRRLQARLDSRHLYLPGPRRGLFNPVALRSYREVIVCEAVIDALTFWCAGYRNVTCAFGVDGFSEELMTAMKRHGTQRVLIAYDRDEAGDLGAQKLSMRLMTEGIECYRIQFPHGMDANSFAIKVKPPEHSMGMVIQAAEWMGKGTPPAKVIESSTSQPEMRPVVEEPESKAQLREMPPPSAADDVPTHPASAPEPAAGLVELVASPVPPAPDPGPEVKDQEIVWQLGDRRYRVRGLWKNTSMETMRVNVFVLRGERFHGDTLDLNQDRPREHFIGRGYKELGITEALMRNDVGKLWIGLGALQDEHLTKLKEPKGAKRKVLSDDEKRDAMTLLKDPGFLQRILRDFESCGVVGEEMNKLTGYIAAVSRKMRKPLAVVIQSTTAAGKSSLMDAILSFFPEEDLAKYSAMTSKSLYYMSTTDLKHKVLALAEEEGAEKASYALKLLQSDGVLITASTGKDQSGKLETRDYRVEGPVNIFMTTTQVDMDEEFLNRCLMLTVDEGREQTRRIHDQQRRQQTREWAEGAPKRGEIRNQHRNAQRMLRKLGVFNPYAFQLTFPDGRLRLRRDHEKYISLISAIALLHQYQREVFEMVQEDGEVLECVEVTIDDIRMANRIANGVLGRSLEDLPVQTKKLLTELERLVRQKAEHEQMEAAEVRFSRRDIREFTGMGYTQLQVHLGRLVAMEYLLPHRGQRGQSFVYELIYDGKGQDGAPFLPGLVDVDTLTRPDPRRTISSSRGDGGPVTLPNRPQIAPKTVGVGVSQSAETPHPTGLNGTSHTHVEKFAVPRQGTFPGRPS